MVVTLSGIMTEAINEQFSNAELWICSHSEPRHNSTNEHPMKPLWSNESMGLGSSCMWRSDKQSQNAELLILVTLPGIVIDVSKEHSSNAESPIRVTLFGIVIDLSDEQA